MTGRLIETIVEGTHKPGVHDVMWDGSKHSSGIYFYRILTPDYRSTKKMLLLK